FLIFALIFSCQLINAQTSTAIDTVHEQLHGLKKYHGYAAGMTPKHLMLIGGRVGGQQEDLHIDGVGQEKISAKIKNGFFMVFSFSPFGK
ncbi:MAG: hypothetical protein AAFP02_18470, partial [Bacteroidota bacterium]